MSQRHTLLPGQRGLRNDNPGGERRETPRLGDDPLTRTFLNNAQPQRTMSSKGQDSRPQNPDKLRSGAPSDVTAGRRGDVPADPRVRAAVLSRKFLNSVTLFRTRPHLDGTASSLLGANFSRKRLDQLCSHLEPYTLTKDLVFNSLQQLKHTLISHIFCVAVYWPHCKVHVVVTPARHAVHVLSTCYLHHTCL
ncbi:uncharacterized protein LOC143434432 [Arvicanthis niloticus]|uniref:uncharacterized protein LOC143434432 n=1 Tax=Arvicanthis niloticus TaxID=61156 RepID=UPI00403CBD97